MLDLHTSSIPKENLIKFGCFFVAVVISTQFVRFVVQIVARYVRCIYMLGHALCRVVRAKCPFDKNRYHYKNYKTIKTFEKALSPSSYAPEYHLGKHQRSFSGFVPELPLN